MYTGVHTGQFPTVGVHTIYIHALHAVPLM